MTVLNQNQSTDISIWLTSSRTKIVFSIFALIILCYFSWLTFNMVQKYRETLDISQQHATLKTQEIANAIDKKLTRLVLTAEELVENLRRSALDKHAIETELKKSELNHTNFYALGAAFDLYKISPQLRLFAPFIYLNDPSNKIDGLDHHYDYTSNNTSSDTNDQHWFAQGSAGLRGWLPPSFDMAHKQHVLKYVTPIRSSKNEGAVEGVVFLDIELEWIR